jgi:hypothetical protein
VSHLLVSLTLYIWAVEHVLDRGFIFLLACQKRRACKGRRRGKQNTSPVTPQTCGGLLLDKLSCHVPAMTPIDAAMGTHVANGLTIITAATTTNTASRLETHARRRATQRSVARLPIPEIKDRVLHGIALSWFIALIDLHIFSHALISSFVDIIPYSAAY